MKKIDYKKIEGILFYILAGITILWFFPFISKGIDVTDTAYYLTNYKYYLDIDVDLRRMGTFLTDLLGAGIYHIRDFGQFILLAFCHWSLYMGSGLLAYWAIRDYAPRLLLLLAFLGGSFYSLPGPHVLSYNSTSMFLQMLAIYWLIKAFKSSKSRLYFISGIVLGMNTFFRLPNILQVCISASILWHFLFCKHEWKQGIQKMCLHGAGILTGWGIGGGLALVVLGRERIYSYLFSTVNTAADSQSSHGIKNMLVKIYNETRQGGKDWIRYGVLLLGIILLWNILKRKKYLSEKKKCWIYLLISGAVTVYGVFIGQQLTAKDFCQMIALCVGCVMFYGVFYYKKRDVLLSSICFIGLCAESVLCIGTDNGLYYQVSFLIFPLCVCVAEVWNYRDKQFKSSLILCMLFAAALTFSVGIPYGTQYVYRDAPYEELNYPIKAKEYMGIQTERERSKYIDELKEILDSLDEEYLLAYGDCNIGYVIADKKPFVNKSWIDLQSYPVEQLKKEMKTGIQEKGYPVILLADLDKDGQYRSEEKLKIIEEFLREGNYKKYYENEWYRVYSIRTADNVRPF